LSAATKIPSQFCLNIVNQWRYYQYKLSYKNKQFS